MITGLSDVDSMSRAGLTGLGQALKERTSYEPQEPVGVLFENQGPKGLLHLLWDAREATGAGESRFVRGACWVGSIREVSSL